MNVRLSVRIESMLVRVGESSLFIMRRGLKAPGVPPSSEVVEAL